jgi:uncharacterized protein YuzE
MVTTDTVEGQINGTVSYHYDVFADVLYLRLVSDMQTPSIGEETDGGDIELHEETTGRLIGITVISWWKRFGQGSLPDSLRELAARIEPFARKVAA